MVLRRGFTVLAARTFSPWRYVRQIVLRPKELSGQVAKGKTPWGQLGRDSSSTGDPASLQSLFLRLHSLAEAGKTWIGLGRRLHGLPSAGQEAGYARKARPSAQGPPLRQALRALPEKFCYWVAVQLLSQALVLLVFFSPDKSAHTLDFHSNISEQLRRSSAAVYNMRKINPGAI